MTDPDQEEEDDDDEDQELADEEAADFDVRQHWQPRAAGCFTFGPFTSDAFLFHRRRPSGSVGLVISRNVSDTRSPLELASSTPCLKPYREMPLMTYMLPAFISTSIDPSVPGSLVSGVQVRTNDICAVAPSDTPTTTGPILVSWSWWKRM